MKNGTIFVITLTKYKTMKKLVLQMLIQLNFYTINRDRIVALGIESFKSKKHKCY